MPKFYVESGTLQLVTTANDPRAAAIWAVHRTLSPALPFLSETARTDARLPPSSEKQLGEIIRVSERGFGRTDGHSYETLETVCEWTLLLIAVDRLHKRLEVCVASGE